MNASSPGIVDASTRLDAAREARLRRVLAIHFDPVTGSPFWCDRARALGLDAVAEIRTVADLDRLGVTSAEDLLDRSVRDFIPRSMRTTAASLVHVESGGTLGRPKPTAFREDEFHEAFVAPFLASEPFTTPLPRGAGWLWIGPSGPHAIGKAARRVARALGSMDPFEIDLDPRWFKAQTPGSMGRERYLAHVVEQSLAILRREPVEVLFTTPPVLVALARRLPDVTREQIALVHWGGMAAENDAVQEIEAAYPRARFLGGYGNSLLGVCPQIGAPGLREVVYRPRGERWHLRLIPTDASAETWAGETVPDGERGRVLATRIDETCLLVNLLERDTAVGVPVHDAALEAGFHPIGLRDLRPVGDVSPDRIGIY